MPDRDTMIESSGHVRVRLLLARQGEGEPAIALGAVDEAMWDNWDNDDERRWRDACEADWYTNLGYEIRECWAVFPADRLAAVFNTATVEGDVEAGE